MLGAPWLQLPLAPAVVGSSAVVHITNRRTIRRYGRLQRGIEKGPRIRGLADRGHACLRCRAADRVSKCDAASGRPCGHNWSAGVACCARPASRDSTLPGFAEFPGEYQQRRCLLPLHLHLHLHPRLHLQLRLRLLLLRPSSMVAVVAETTVVATRPTDNDVPRSGRPRSIGPDKLSNIDGLPVSDDQNENSTPLSRRRYAAFRRAASGHPASGLFL